MPPRSVLVLDPATPTSAIGVHALALLGTGNAVRRPTRHLSPPAGPAPDPASVP